MPQTIILLDEKPDGWKLIKTPDGNSWIATVKYRAYVVTGTVKVRGLNRDISRRVYRLNKIERDYVASLDVIQESKSNLQLALKA